MMSSRVWVFPQAKARDFGLGRLALWVRRPQLLETQQQPYASEFQRYAPKTIRKSMGRTCPAMHRSTIGL
jgi:hypothetical protein